MVADQRIQRISLDYLTPSELNLRKAAIETVMNRAGIAGGPNS